MTIQELKIDVIQKILTTDNAHSLENIFNFVNDELNVDSDSEKETQKGIETILKMVKEFN